MRWIYLLFVIGSVFISSNSEASDRDPPKSLRARLAKSTDEITRQVKLDALQIAVLIKSTIIALQQANQTGNYSVLRDLGTPVFRERFDQTRLAAIFQNLRERGVNLSPVMWLTPSLTKQPELTMQNQLHLVGYFPTQPLQVQYELLFLQIDGMWRIEELYVDALPLRDVALSASPSQVVPAKPAEAANWVPKSQN